MNQDSGKRPTADSTAPISSRDPIEPVLTAFKALGFALSARSLLLVSLVGAFVLAVMAMLSQTLPALEVLIAFSVFTVVPFSVLEIRRRA